MLIQVEGISKRFGGLQAVDNVSLGVSSGEVMAVIGPNGAGKSTLLDCLSGITPFDSGSVVIDGARHSSIDIGRLVAIGMTRTFQNIRLWENLTVREHVKLARIAYRRSPRGRHADGEPADVVVDRLLARVNLQRKKDLYPSELSYGERRLLEIARALATEPKLLLLDEPAAGSNLSEHTVLAELISGIARSGVAIVLVEHHMDLVEVVSTRVLVLNFGKVIVTGTLADVRRNPEVISVYLGTAA